MFYPFTIEKNDLYWFDDSKILDSPLRISQNLIIATEIRLGHPPSSRFWRYHSEGTGQVAGWPPMIRLPLVATPKLPWENSQFCRKIHENPDKLKFKLINCLGVTICYYTKCMKRSIFRHDQGQVLHRYEICIHHFSTHIDFIWLDQHTS